jgi:hypothetical protein
MPAAPPSRRRDAAEVKAMSRRNRKSHFTNKAPQSSAQQTSVQRSNAQQNNVQQHGNTPPNGPRQENVGGEPETLSTRWISIGGENRTKGRSQQVRAERAEGVAPAAVQWLADGRAPQGALCVVAGEPGTCKSLLATEWAARVSNGREHRDAALIAHAADLPAPILRARLDAAGATIQRVAMATLRWPEPGDDASLAELDRRVAALACGIDEGNDARLIIVDNLEAWAGGLDAAPCRARVHYLLNKLSELAVRTKTAIVVLARLNGPAGGRVATRELAELSAISPVVYLAARDAEQPKRRLLLPIKNSLGPEAPAAAFRIEAGRVAWELEPVELSDTMVTPPTARQVAEQQDREDAAEWLLSALSDGPVESTDLFRQARSCGISAKTLRRAGKALGLKPVKTAFDGPWEWEIPKSECGIRNAENDAAQSPDCGAEASETGDAVQDGQLRRGKFGAQPAEVACGRA